MATPRFDVVLITLALAGCGLMQSKVSAETLEGELIRWLADSGLSASAARCPADQKLVKGNVFECTAVVEEVEIPIRVEVTDSTAGMVEWTPKYKTMTKSQLERWLLTLPDLLDRELTVDCPGAVFVTVPDSQVQCEIVDQSTQMSFVGTLTFTDGEGGYSWRVDPKS